MNIQVNTLHKTPSIRRIEKESLQQPKISSVFFFLVVLIAAHAIGPLYASADNITMEWERSNPVNEVVQYKIYYRIGGTGSGIIGNYTGSGLVFDGAPLDGTPVDSGTAIDVGNLAQQGNLVSIGLRNVDPLETYCFVVTALSNDAESSPSNEACQTGPTPPTITSSPVVAVDVGLPYVYDVEASGDPVLDHELTDAPAGMTIDSATGLINWTPQAAGAYDVTVRVSNPHGSDTQTFMIDVSDPATEIIVDNEDGGTTAIGTWNVSSGVNPYGSNSLCSNVLSSSFAFETTRSGLQEVSLWWTIHSNRNTQTPVEIYNDAQLLDTVTVDQTQNGGMWNVLGAYAFSGQARVVIISNTTAVSACADAVRFRAMNPGAPVISSLEINGATGAMAVYTNDPGRQISVRIFANDDNSVSEYAILENNNDPGVAAFSAIPGGASTNVDFTVPFTLADLDGSRTIYAWVKDNNGIVSSTATKSNVTLDRTLPTSTTDFPITGSRVTSLSAISGASSDSSGSGVSSIQILVTDGTRYLRANDAWTTSVEWFTPDNATDLSNWSHDTTNVSLQLLTAYTVRARATDRAGNVQSPVHEISFDYGDLPPVDNDPPIGNITYSGSDSSHVAPGVFTISSGFNEPLNGAPNITIAGGGPLASAPAPMSGAGANWSYTVTVPFGDNTAYTVTISDVADLAGNTTSLSGNFTTDTIDTDGDGLRNYQDDNDDDNDGWTDDFEIQLGLDPLVDDRNGDLDGDGYTNIEEINAGTDPGNKGPRQPELIPVGSPSSVTPDLATLPYIDEEGDAHVTTIWEISTDSSFSDNSQVVFHLESDDFLESVSVPSLILTPESGVPYYWRVQFFDNQNGPSLWSAVSSFSTGSDPDDANGDGIPDSNVDDNTVDLNGDGTNDAFSTSYRAVHTAVGDNVIGVEVVTPGVQIDYLKAISPGSISDPYGRPASLPIGLVNFRLSGVPVGGSAEVTILPLNPVDNLVWYYYDLSTGWLDYSANTISNPDGSLTITLMDGDVGDCDGAANGIIVDPFGPGGSGGGALAAPSVIGDVGAGGGGCFIATAAFGSPMERQVRHLSEFRDRYMLTNAVGKRCVDFYYRHSPSLADHIREHSALKTVVRMVLLPIAGVAYMAVQFGSFPVLLAGFGFFICLSMIMVNLKRRRCAEPEL